MLREGHAQVEGQVGGALLGASRLQLLLQALDLRAHLPDVRRLGHLLIHLWPVADVLGAMCVIQCAQRLLHALPLQRRTSGEIVYMVTAGMVRALIRSMHASADPFLVSQTTNVKLRSDSLGSGGALVRSWQEQSTHGWRDGGNDAGLGAAAQGLLQQPRELRVAVGHMSLWTNRQHVMSAGCAPALASALQPAL